MTAAVYERERVGVYPGSFDPPTIAHLGIAVMARRVANLARIDLVISEEALAKEEADHAPFDLRVAVIEASIGHLPWLGLQVTRKQLIVDIAQGYDAVLMGADKFHQIREVRFYADEAARDAAMAALPQVVGPNRPGAPPLPESAVVLELPPKLQQVSSSDARTARPEWMTPPARKTAEVHGIWGL
jgi:phosphopantetheine adenylyltransferase